MFIVVEKLSNHAIGILDTNDCSIEYCSTKECLNYLNLGIAVRGMSLVHGKLQVSIAESVTHLEDSDSKVEVIIRAGGSLCVRQTNSNMPIFSRNVIKLTNRDFCDIKSVMLSDKNVLFDIELYTRDEDFSSVRTEVYAFNLNAKQARLLAKSQTFFSTSSEGLPQLRYDSDKDEFYFGGKLLIF